MDLNMKIRDIRKRIFKLFRPIIEQAPEIGKKVSKNPQSYNEESVIEAEY